MSTVKVTGTKLKMTQIFMEDGEVVPVTLVKVANGVFDSFSEGTAVSVTGVSKGKGFSGAVKRYSFAGGPKTHGQSDRHRAVGSIGAGTFPGKVWKGKKMPGRMGNERVTVRGLSIVKVDSENNIVSVKGAIPGSVYSTVTIQFEGKETGT